MYFLEIIIYLLYTVTQCVNDGNTTDICMKNVISDAQIR